MPSPPSGANSNDWGRMGSEISLQGHGGKASGPPAPHGTHPRACPAHPGQLQDPFLQHTRVQAPSELLQEQGWPNHRAQLQPRQLLQRVKVPAGWRMAGAAAGSALQLETRGLVECRHCRVHPPHHHRAGWALPAHLSSEGRRMSAEVAGCTLR